MSFFGLMTVKAHEAALAHERYFIACRDETIVARNATIERLQRENARLLAEVSGPQEQKDEGATYVLKSLAGALHVEDWSIQNGSEEWEGDVWATMFRILVDAGVVEEDHHTVATHKVIAGLNAQLTAEIRATQNYAKQVLDLAPDAEKYRERCRRDREHAAAKRAQKVAA